jgi:hypothetical protein
MGTASVLRSARLPRGVLALQTDATAHAPPDAFGPFRVLHQIGTGSLGPVFRAYHPEQDRLVAVKVFRLDLPPERVDRLVTELNKLIALDLDHVAVAAPIAAGVSGPSAYLALDFVAAESLDVFSREPGRLDSSEVSRITSQFAAAIDAAHLAGVVHGALHPRDVLVSADEARLTGLGIVQALEVIGVDAPIRPPYSAPERGARGAWDRRADTFGTAAISFELLFGRRQTSQIGSGAADAITATARGNLTALRDVFARGLAEHPGDRFQTASAFADALRLALGGSRRGPTPDARRAWERETERARAARLPIDDPDDPMPLAAPGNLAGADLDLRPPPDRPGPEAGELTMTPADRPDTIVDSADTPVGGVLIGSGNSQGDPAAVADAVDPSASGIGATATGGVAVAAPALFQTASRPSVEGRVSRGVWPLVLALLVGAALGFALCLAVASRDGAPAELASREAPASQGTFAPASAVTRDTVPPVAPGASRSIGPPDPTPGAVLPRPPSGAQTSAAGPDQSAKNVSTVEEIPPAARSAGRLVIRSTPPGARVLVNGRDRGVTPLTLRDVAMGAYTIRLQRDGYAPEERRVVVSEARAAATVSLPLARLGAAPDETNRTSDPRRVTGSLMVDSRPAGASVFVDDRLVGTTPLLIDPLDVGEHRVRIERDGYRRWTSSVRIVAGERQRVAASLEQ